MGCAHEHAAPAARTPDDETSDAAAPVAVVVVDPPGLHALAALPALPASGTCGALERFEPAQSLPLLAGRFLVPMPSDGRLPEGTPFESRDGSVVRETIAYVERGTIQLTLIAEETLGRAEGELAAYVVETETAEVPNGIVAPARIAGAFDGVVVESTDPAPRTGNLTVARLYFESAEGTVVHVRFVVTSVAEPMTAARCRPLVRRVLAGLSAGPVQLDVDGSTRSIGPLLTLDVPAGFVVEDRTAYGDPTLIVERLRPIRELPSALTVTVSLHPPNIEMPRDRSGPYLGRTVSWRNLYGDAYERRSALLHIPGHPEYAHSIAEAPTIAQVSELMALAGRIQVRR